MKLKQSIEAARETASRQMHDGLERALEAVGLQVLHKSSSVTLSVLAGVGVGILIGGAAALLLAPMPGTDLRKRLAERVTALMPGSSEPNESEDKPASDTSAATHSQATKPEPVVATVGPFTGTANGHTNRLHKPGDPIIPG
jgi:hypothetical protein